ncbi:uncharacterized protein JCM10292_005917 [Rhodotorula paludigena]|uniref:uncharacterized protein n=1 Tax=Rhodotorula paludigena TaxID=86838 RepID=UPI00317CFD82
MLLSSLVSACALLGAGSLSLALASPDPGIALDSGRTAELDKRSPEPFADLEERGGHGDHPRKGKHRGGKDRHKDVDIDIEIDIGIDRFGDDTRDGCPRRYHRYRGRCYPNKGHGGCWRGYRRDRRGICRRVRVDIDIDIDINVDGHGRKGGRWLGNIKPGRCPHDWQPNGAPRSGNDGWSFDSYGHGPPSWAPAGWAYFGRSYGWAPVRGWMPKGGWRPSDVFIRIWIRITWWVPPREWCHYWFGRWPGSWKVPSHWNWHPKSGGGGGEHRA